MTFIDGAKAAGTQHVVIARKLFSYDHPFAFEGNQEKAFELFNKTANQFRVPINHIKAVGSAQLGYSFLKKTPFVTRRSDLDLAIIDPPLFQIYCEAGYRVTRGYTDLTAFPRRDGVDVPKAFYQSLARGFFRPDYMPICTERETWFRFFNAMSRLHSNLFKTVNCGIYFSSSFFDAKQSLIVDQYLESKK